MPFKKMRIKCKARGSRGTEGASEMLELMSSNWEQIRDAFAQYSDEEQNELMDHFNDTLDDLGENLFGEDAQMEDFKTYITGMEEEDQKKFLAAVKESLMLEDPQ